MNTVQPDDHLREADLSQGTRPVRRLPLRIVVAHDWLCGLRGGERVLDDILTALDSIGATVPELLVMFDDGRGVTPRIDATATHASPLSRLGWVSRALRRHMLPLYPLAVSRLGDYLERLHRRDPINLVISTSSAAIKGLRCPKGVAHLSYIHSPPRYLWSQQDEYSKDSAIRRMGLALTGPILRRWDKATAANVTAFMANSMHTQQLITNAYERTSVVVHPGVRTDYFTPDAAVPRDGSWLVVCALEPYKRVELAIEAANAAQHSLTIVGDGSHRRMLETLAGPTVRFAGRIDDAELLRAYRRASVLLHPQVEDFGIVAAEAQAAGLAVAAFGKGGARETVVDGSSGVLFHEQTADSVIAAANRAQELCGEPCRQSALRFSREAFRERFLNFAAAWLS